MKFFLALALAALLLYPASLVAQEAETASVDVTITEWKVPWAETRPRDPYVGHDGRIWFVGQRAHYVAVLDPETGEMERIDLGDGAGPHTVIVDAHGTPWYAGNRDMHIGRIDLASYEITRFDMPDERVRDPHTMAFDADGYLWFTAQGGNHLGRMNPQTGEVDVMPVSIERARPYGIVLADDRTPWAVLFGTNRLASVDPATLEVTEHILPREETRPRRLAVTSDGGVWYVDYAAGYLGRFDPATGDVREWAAPAGADSRPYAVTADDRDRIWFFETGPSPNTLVGFDPAMETWIDGGSPESGGGTVRHMVFDPATSSIWFGTDTNTIGRAVIE